MTFFEKACTELNTVQETNGVTDMFPPIPYNPELRQQYCKKVWDVNIRERWTEIEFWGRNINTASNIVFSNGVRRQKLVFLWFQLLTENIKNPFCLYSFWIHGTMVAH